MINFELLDKCIEWAERSDILEDGDWDQTLWWHPGSSKDCHTACCIAGRAVLASGLHIFNPCCPTVSETGRTVADEAARLLGLNLDQAEELFCSFNSINNLKALAKEFKAQEGGII